MDYPLIETTNTNTIDIARVEMTDSATVLRTKAQFWPHNWIRIDSKSYLLADGKKYMLTGAEGITPDSLFWMPDSGKAAFTLRFEPLPMDTRQFDFIESDCEDCFKLFGIDLTGKKTFDTPKEVPDGFRKADEKADMPAPIFKTGTTSLRVHLMHYRPQLGRELSLYVYTLFGTQQPYTAAIDSATAQASFSFLQCGTAQAFLSLGGNPCGNIWLAPGEETEVYVDMRVLGFYHQQKYRRGTATPPTIPFQRLYASGTYANLNNVENTLDDYPYYNLDLYTSTFANYHMNSAAYAAHVVAVYQQMADSIADSQLPPLRKELAQLTLRQDAFKAMSKGDFLRTYNYRHAYNLWKEPLPANTIDPLKPEDAQRICQLFDINDPKLLMGRSCMEYVGAVGFSNFDWAQLAGVQKGQVKDLALALPYFPKAENIELADSDYVRLRDGLDNPFYLGALIRIQKDAKDKLAAVADKAKVMDTPDVPNEKLFDAIIAPHKGKVVFVDFWNTWCGPCRAAIKATEPLKSGVLQDDNLVWIYIANETSPLVAYKTAIANIQGIHYRLDQTQWDYLCDKFQIDGIPSYVLVDKAGRYSLRNDLRDHDRLVKTLQEEMAK